MARSKKLLLAISSSLVACGTGYMTSPAYAQAVQGTTAGGLEEVIVTARKREESLQEVPISIRVLDADFLATSRILDVQNALIRVPGIGFGQPFKSYTPIAIRGASTQDDSIGVDPNVAIFIDGVNVRVNDIDRI